MQIRPLIQNNYFRISPSPFSLGIKGVQNDPISFEYLDINNVFNIKANTAKLSDFFFSFSRPMPSRAFRTLGKETTNMRANIMYTVR